MSAPARLETRDDFHCVCVMTFNRWTSLWWRERVLDAGSRILPEINLDSCSFSGDLQPPEIPDCVVPTQT